MLKLLSLLQKWRKASGTWVCNIATPFRSERCSSIHSFSIHFPLLGYDFPLLILSWAGFCSEGFLVSILQKPLHAFQAGMWEEICSFHTFLIRNAEYASRMFSFPAATSVSARFPAGANQCGSSGTTSNVQSGVIRWSGSRLKALCSSMWHLNLKMFNTVT